MATDMYPTMIQTAIEFCLNIKAYTLLFDDVYDFLFDLQLQDVFVEILEQFIMTGSFKNCKMPTGEGDKFKICKVPDDLVCKLVYKHSERGTFQDLDKMVKQLDWSDYGYLAELEQLCQQKFLISSVFTIQMCQRQGSHYDKCLSVLKNMYKMLCQAKDLEKSK